MSAPGDGGAPLAGAAGSVDLLPCPFCGGVAQIERMGSRLQSMIIACEDCGCQLESSDTAIIDEKRWDWNRRVQPNATSSAMDCRPPNPPAAGLAWVLVPRIPTLAMMEAGWGICGGPGYAAIQTNPDKVLNALARFERVVAAAPNAPRSATPGGGQ